ncbi:DUF1648 domain-containing protein [Paenibacillus sp. HN-1]|uniref:DUF1648 domain-containing protein n=1 Tax=Paenibacillus TaxID=44249 RepID=UPI001CA8A0BC|nr:MULTISPECIES: DUF1648 domain-containing protein [Paenibacillus]MBY9077442.1 DUF1648 domain-containing protein [Paenibacillus sp. CGMCC 1.18879]MBY9084781.1 DUF1648 domain-containing protein [Paenibacillus sinensis]
MKRRARFIVAASAVLGLIPFIAYAVLYPKMPDQVPVHFTGGTADRFTGKWGFELLLLAGVGEVGLVVMLLIRAFLGGMLPQGRLPGGGREGDAVWRIAIPAVTLLFAGISIRALFEMI